MSRWLYVETLEDDRGVRFRHLVVDAADEEEAYSEGIDLIGPCPPSVKLSNHVIKMDEQSAPDLSGTRAAG